MDVTGGRTVGVRMTGGHEIRCRKGVVSAAGYRNTMAMLGETVISQHKLPQLPPSLAQSAGFVMCNIGITAESPDCIGATNSNTWHVSIKFFAALMLGQLGTVMGLFFVDSCCCGR